MMKRRNFIWQAGVDFRKLRGFEEYRDHVVGCASDISHAAEIHHFCSLARKREGYKGLIAAVRIQRSQSRTDFRRWNRERAAIKNFAKILRATDLLSLELLAAVADYNLMICTGLEEPYNARRFWVRGIRSILKNFSQEEISNWAFHRRFVDPSCCSGVNSYENDRKLIRNYLDHILSVIEMHMKYKISAHRQYRDIEYKWRYGVGEDTRRSLATAILPNEGFTFGL